MPTHLESAIHSAAQQLALGILAKLRSASVQELLTLAGGRAAPSETSFERSATVGDARIRQAVRELSTDASLSPVESEVLGRAAVGETRKQIAKNMGVSVNTTKLRIRRMLGKVGATNLTDVAAKALHRAVTYR